MAKIGILNELRITRGVNSGVYLDGEKLGEILLPRKYAPEDCKPGDILTVFIYHDSEDHIVATTDKPYAMVDDFALLKVVAVTSVGAFLDWGLPKDLLVPFSEQHPTMKEGMSYIVKIYLDDKSHRIAATSKLDYHLDYEPGNFKAGQEVDLLICNQTDIGHNAIINNSHWGMLHFSDVFQPLKKGQKLKGFVKNVRDDGKIDLCLHKPGYEKVGDVTDSIYTALKKQGGFISITDKSSPEMIYKAFGVSKKTYKKAIGALYRKRLITIEDNGIKLINF